MRRKTPLRRKTWMNRSPSLRLRTKSKYRRRPRDLEFMRWVRRQPCCARDFDPDRCNGRVEADHAGRRGLGTKADDRSCIPLCQQHHQARGSFSGPFWTWGQAQMRAWLVAMVAATQEAFEARPKP